MSWNLKAYIAIIAVILFAVGVLYKKMSPTLDLKYQLASAQMDLIETKMKLNLYQNNTITNKTLLSHSDVQNSIVESISKDTKIELVSFSNVASDNDMVLEFYVEVSGDQADLLIWYKQFDNKFDEAVRTEVSLIQKKRGIILRLFFKMQEF
jgi:hypothetical protein